MPKKYRALATEWHGHKVSIMPELQSAWDRAHAALPPRYWLKELTQSYYELRAPWGFGLRFGESGVSLNTACCRTFFNRFDGPLLSCGQCGVPSPVPADFRQLSNWNGADGWLEEALGYYGQDVLTAAVSASILPHLRAVGEASGPW